jgi:hypothetical protein
MPKFNELYLNGMTYHAIPPEQKKLLQEQPVLRKKSERKIIQHTIVIEEQEYDAAKSKKTNFNCGEFWAWGYKMSVDILPTINYWNDKLNLNVKNLTLESLVPLQFAYWQNGSIVARGQDTFSRTKQQSCESWGSADFDNEDNTCELSVIVEPV